MSFSRTPFVISDVNIFQQLVHDASKDQKRAGGGAGAISPLNLEGHEISNVRARALKV